MLKDEKINTNVGVGTGILLMSLAGIAPTGTFSQSTAQIVFAIGVVLYLWGCISYALAKGHSGLWGLVAPIPFVGLIILAALPDKYAEESARWGRRGCAYVVVAVLLSSLGFAGWYVLHKPHPISVEEAQRRALKLYPQLGIRDSPLNREFVTRYNRYQATNKDYFKQPQWPLTLAAESHVALAHSQSH